MQQPCPTHADPPHPMYLALNNVQRFLTPPAPIPTTLDKYKETAKKPFPYTLDGYYFYTRSTYLYQTVGGPWAAGPGRVRFRVRESHQLGRAMTSANEDVFKTVVVSQWEDINDFHNISFGLRTQDLSNYLAKHDGKGVLRFKLYDPDMMECHAFNHEETGEWRQWGMVILDDGVNLPEYLATEYPELPGYTWVGRAHYRLYKVTILSLFEVFKGFRRKGMRTNRMSTQVLIVADLNVSVKPECSLPDPSASTRIDPTVIHRDAIFETAPFGALMQALHADMTTDNADELEIDDEYLELMGYAMTEHQNGTANIDEAWGFMLVAKQMTQILFPEAFTGLPYAELEGFMMKVSRWTRGGVEFELEEGSLEWRQQALQELKRYAALFRSHTQRNIDRPEFQTLPEYLQRLFVRLFDFSGGIIGLDKMEEFFEKEITPAYEQFMEEERQRAELLAGVAGGTGEDGDVNMQ